MSSENNHLQFPDHTNCEKHALADIEALSSPSQVMIIGASAQAYDYTPFLKGQARWLGIAVLATLSRKEERRDFWQCYREILAIWNDVPFLVDGEAWPVEQRRQLLTDYIESVVQDRRILGGRSATKYDRNWRRFMSLKWHGRIKDECVRKVNQRTSLPIRVAEGESPQEKAE